MAQLVVRTAEESELGEVAETILSANPHIRDRVQHFVAAGGSWNEATPIVGELNGCIRSCAIVFRRQLWRDRTKVAFGGVGAVCTHPEQRGKGYARCVLKYCEEFLASEGYRVAMLFCSIVEFYKREGWVQKEEDYVEFSLETPFMITPEAAYRYCPVTPRTMRHCEIVYEQSASESAGALVRSQGIWEEYRRWKREDADLFWVALDGEHTVAYARGKRCDTGMLLHEATHLPGHEGALLGLLSRQREIVCPSAGKTFRAKLSREHALAGLLAKAGINLVWSRTSARTSVMMIKELASSIGTETRVTTEKGRTLDIADFGEPLPWAPRTWWAIDQF